MSTVRFEVDSDQVYSIIGELNMSSVPQLLKDMSALFTGDGDARILDLTEVSRSDSAGLALLLEWQAQAQQNNIQLSFRNIPQQLQAIAKISGLEKLIA